MGGRNLGPKLGGKLQISLKAAGNFNEIDVILLTHIHTDHSGVGRRWSTGAPAAILYVGKPDVDFWFDQANATRSFVENYFDEAAKLPTLFRCR